MWRCPGASTEKGGGKDTAATTMAGKVYLVGAGPGDPGLLTLKGKQALERADCIVYDLLVNEDLLRWCRPEAEKVCARRHNGQAALSQEEINGLLVSKARDDLVVARLKGGDPFIFGRGGEEAEALARAGIPFEVVPGVSSGYAVPAYAGIPVTHRNLASSVSFVTGHTDPGLQGSLRDWSPGARLEGTLVFFMGVAKLPKIVARLIRQGRGPDTPAAVIHRGTLPEQRVVTGKLADIVRKSSRILPPSVLVVGEVVKLREQLNWFERLPLFGKRIAITRAREQAEVLREALEELGAKVVEIPTIEIRPPASWQPLDQAIERLDSFDYLLVTSANGARNFLSRLMASGRDVRALKGIKIGAIGPATAAEFAKAGVRVDFVPQRHQAEGLLEVLAGQELRGKAFLIPRAKVARDVVPRVLAEQGAGVEVVEAYQTVPPAYGPQELSRLLKPDLITFTSSSTASNFVQLVRGSRISETLLGVAMASIGPITSDTLRKLGLRVAVEASESTIPGLVRAIQEYFSRASG